jgi:demethylmenaquinone methyltransferase / 2-methoxy-6-polyprenyl-1,4-benzoquinol methylase
MNKERKIEEMFFVHDYLFFVTSGSTQPGFRCVTCLCRQAGSLVRLYRYSAGAIRVSPHAGLYQAGMLQTGNNIYLCAPMSKYSHDTIVPFKDSEKSKKEQVAGMFDQIAFRYDFLNRFLSGGVDSYWRRRAVRELAALNPQMVLDVATGTADVAIMTWKYLHPQKIIGIDISEGMLQLGRQKVDKLLLNKHIELLKGDSEAINFPPGTFDAITVAFGVRNFENLEKGLAEMYRVLRSGGKVVILEFSRPRSLWFKGLYNLYMKIVAPRAGRWLSKNKDAYQYLNQSVKAFPEGETFLHILQQVGFTETTFKRLSLGICTIYCGRKRAS